MQSDIYLIYNNLVWNRWLSASQGSSYLIAKYDDDDHQKVVTEMDVTEHELIESTMRFGGYYWRGFIGHSNNIPLGVGIIALQILSASRMTQREYRDGFSTLMNITVAHLQEAFDCSQHTIWKQFSEALKLNGFKSNIQARQGPWCFVNYPLYQSYLNQQDIESIVPYFLSLSINLNHKLKFDDFISMYRLDEAYRYRNCITNRFTSKLENENFSKEIIYRQVYQRYLSLSPAPPSESTPKANGCSSLLCFSLSDHFFQIVGDETILLSSESISNKLKELGYKISKPILLKYDSSMMEYQEVNRFDSNDKALIVTLSQNSTIYQILYESVTPKELNGVFLFFIDSVKEYAQLLSEYTSKKDSSIQISKGLKIHRKAYLYGYGPTISAQQSITIFINGEKHDLQPEGDINFSDYEPGLYEIKVPDEPVLTFYIQKLKNNIEVIHKTDGLSFLSMRYDGTDIYGHEITVNSIKLETATPRRYINYFNKPSSMESNPPNLVFKNLKQQQR